MTETTNPDPEELSQMATRRQFITTTAAAAITASVLPSTGKLEDPTAASGRSDDRGPETRAPANELTRYNTMAAFAQSVPFPEG